MLRASTHFGIALAVVWLGCSVSLPAAAICLDPPGDVNGDGTTTVVDAQCTILMNLWSLAGQTAEVPTCIGETGIPTIVTDHNCDLVLNVADTLIAIQFALKLGLNSALDADSDLCVDACQTDLDGDEDLDLTDCAPLDAFVYSGAVELCNGFDDDCDGLVDETDELSVLESCDNTNVCDGQEVCAAVGGPGGVLLSEVMIDPVVLDDAQGEWVELTNASDVAVDIRGWSLGDGTGEPVVIDPGGALFVRPNGTITLGNDEEAFEMGGALLRYIYADLSFDNAAGSVVLFNADGEQVDRLDYDETYGLVSGASLARRSLGFDAGFPDSWAASTATFGDGDRGTPLGPNYDVHVQTCADGDPLVCDDGDPCTEDTCDPDGGCQNSPNGAACDDGDPCTVGDACTPTGCQAGVPLDCDDDNPCTEDACEGEAGCVNTPVTGACDDGNACTFGEACIGGDCTAGIQLECGDGNPCTTDGCSPALGCVYANKAGPCDDGNQCTFNDNCVGGACAPGPSLFCEDGNLCTDDFCNPSTGCQGFFNSKPCDDGNLCTLGDQCANGACLGSGAPNCGDGNPCTDDVCTPLEGCSNVNNADPCSDGNECTADDTCSEGTCQSGPPANCNDANPCTEDSCGEATGCVHLPIGGACDDGNACTTGEACTAGQCTGGTAPTCDDANPCTDDTCDPLTGCVFAPNSATCDDGSACTTVDQCTGGSCAGSSPLNCDDGNPCTDDGCAPAAGCVHTPASGACDDGNPCTTNDQCVSGACAGGAPLNCSDGNPCTDDGCSAPDGCTFTPNTASCSDSDPCTANDTCTGGACTGGAATVCDDSNPCTSDACEAGEGCVFTPTSGNCDDGNSCTTDDSCDGGACVGSGPAVCDDSNPCTNDVCVDGAGCTHPPNSAGCDDGNACTQNDQCSGGSCVGGAALNCNDGNPCTNDTCTPATGCTQTNNSASCSDGNACTQNDTCSGGTCVGGSAPNCNDGNPCTNDSCNPSIGCVTTANSASCDDGNNCTTNDSCSGGSCLGGPPPNCNDGNPCTDDFCQAPSGCTNQPNFAPCSDGNACTLNDQCSGGSCSGGSALSCNDGSNCTSDSCNPSVGCVFTSGAGACSPGQTQDQSCGNCGTQTRTCTGNCAWGGFGACNNQGECSPGQTDSAGCVNSCQSRTCTSACNWPAGNCTGCSGCGNFNKCGLGGCGSGYHATSYTFSSGCGSCCSNNRTACSPNCGNTYNKCGLGGCGTGYHPTAYAFSSGCGSCCSNNRTTCQIDAGSTFKQCGLGGCPAGYQADSFQFSSSCGSCCSNNQTTCKLVTGSNFTKCGLGGCPSGFHASSYQFSSGCGSCCSNNQTTCSPSQGSSFTKCGLGGCPSGYVSDSFFFSSGCGSCCSNNATSCKSI